MATEKLFDEGPKDADDEEAISRSAAILNQRDKARLSARLKRREKNHLDVVLVTRLLESK